VGDLQITTQVKLLRVIETDEVQPLGSDKSYQAHVRYIAATHKDLDAMVQAGQFRRDLYQRLAGNVIRLPPLRDRPEDIREIGRGFVERYVADGALAETRARVDAWLESREAHRHEWLGNVRELQNVLRNLLLGLDAGIERAKGAPAAGSDAESLPPAIRDCAATMKDVEDWYLARVLAHTNDNFAQAARILEVDRTTVRRRSRAL
jgi:DNA-binding NtrC family response regulator